MTPTYTQTFGKLTYLHKTLIFPHVSFMSPCAKPDSLYLVYLLVILSAAGNPQT